MPSGAGNILRGRALWTRAWPNCAVRWTMTQLIRVSSRPSQARGIASLRLCVERGKILICLEGGGSIYSCYHCLYGWVCSQLCWHTYYLNQIHLIYIKRISASLHSYLVRLSECQVLWLSSLAFS